MDVVSLLLILLVIAIGFVAIYLFFKSDLASLRQSLEGTKDSVNTTLIKNTEDINTRLLRATEIIGELKREVNRRPGTPLLGWWQIFGILRSQGLLSRRARFQFVRRRR